MSWKNTWIVLFLIIVFGTGLRMYDLGKNSFGADEFLDMNSSYGYFKTGEWKAWDFNLGKPSEVNLNEARDERANIYKWQAAQLFRFLPPTEETARLVSVFWGVVSMLVLFWSAFVFTRKKEIGLLAALLFSVSIAGIVFDRRLRMYAMFFPLYLASATLLYQIFESEYQGKIKGIQFLWKRFRINALYIIPSLFVFGMTFLTHQLSPHLLLVFGLYLGILTAIHWKESAWKNTYAFVFGLGVLGGILLFLIAPKLVGSFTAGIEFLGGHYTYLSHVFHDYQSPILAIFLLVFGVWFLSVREDEGKAAWYLGLHFFIPLLMAIFLWNRNVGAQYIFFVQSFAMILMAIGIFGVWAMLSERFSWRGKTAFLSLLMLVLLVPNFSYFFEENNTYHETSSSSNPNYRKVFAFFKKERSSSDVLVTRNFRNYYFSGANVRIFDLGDEIDRSRMTVSQFLLIRESNPTGWVILSDNDMSDYISKDLRTYFEKNLERVSNDQVRGSVFVYRW